MLAVEERGAGAIGNGAASIAKFRNLGASPGLFLLFARGGRPDRATILDRIASLSTLVVSHDPGVSQSSLEGGDWLELLADGFTFDLMGLAPGPALSNPSILHRFGLPSDFDAETMEAIAVLPGPHIAGGAHTLPVLRTLASVGCELTRALDRVEAFCWPPAQSAIAAPFFTRIIEGWLDGGPFPALAYTAFVVRDTGALRSEGLAFFTGQEIELDPALSIDRVAATRLAARIIHELVGSGSLFMPQKVVDESGTRLLLSPEAEGALIRVTSV